MLRLTPFGLSRHLPLCFVVAHLSAPWYFCHLIYGRCIRSHSISMLLCRVATFPIVSPGLLEMLLKRIEDLIAELLETIIRGGECLWLNNLLEHLVHNDCVWDMVSGCDWVDDSCLGPLDESLASFSRRIWCRFRRVFITNNPGDKANLTVSYDVDDVILVDAE